MSALHAARRARLAATVAAAGADAALITHLVNVRYLTGLASSNAALLLPAASSADSAAGGANGTDGARANSVAAAAAGGKGGAGSGGSGPVLTTDSRYALAAERDAPDLELLSNRAIEPALARVAVRRGYRRVLFEAHEMTVERYKALSATLGGPPDGCQLAPLGRSVEHMRAAKDDEELDLLRTACQLSSQALEDVLPRIRPGLTERQLAAALEQRMVELGAEKPAFDTIVASGPNGAIPHHVPTGRPIERGDLVVIDFGARYGGYHADMTRTVALGEPAAWQRDIYQLVAAAQRAGVDAARPGTELGAVDAAARDLIADAGHGGHFQHGLGHGVGLEVHEEPLISSGRTGKLTDRVPITIEPGVYLPGKGGVRIEDTLAVRAETTELFTTFTKDLLVL
jgi:Xaa-Pro aminopeptidase